MGGRVAEAQGRARIAAKGSSGEKWQDKGGRGFGQLQVVWVVKGDYGVIQRGGRRRPKRTPGGAGAPSKDILGLGARSNSFFLLNGLSDGFAEGKGDSVDYQFNRPGTLVLGNDS